MNHSFTPSIVDKEKCAICKQDAIAHTEQATCQACNNVGPVDLKYGNFLMCKSCQEKELKAEQERMKPENQQARVEAMNASMNARIRESQAIDSSIQVRGDLFNAATVAIVDLKKAIDDDSQITNKPYALAETLMQRFQHFKNVVFEANEKIIDATNNQKAIQVYLNNLANQLRVEEREKLKLADINYKPGNIKPVKPNVIKTSAAKKLDKAELKKYAAELGIAEFTLQMLVVSKGITVEQAANLLRKSINEAKSEAH